MPRSRFNRSARAAPDVDTATRLSASFQFLMEGGKKSTAEYLLRCLELIEKTAGDR